jgi:DNA-directed RNA polymerase subunit M/transcription elongation factor TFIIS
MKSPNINKLRAKFTNELSNYIGNQSDKIEKAIYDLALNVSLEDTNLEEIYIKIAYDKMGQIVESNKSVKEILKDIRDKSLNWDASYYSIYKQSFMDKIKQSNIKATAVKGIYVCKNRDPKCTNDEFYIWTQQTRAADEGMTVFRQCTKCGKRGKEY